MCGLLIVDDDASIRFAMADYLSAKGYRADSVESREEAEAALASGRYAIVITDLRLTPFDNAEGLRIVRLVAERYREAACIVLTAYGAPDSEAAALRYGARAFLHKPLPLAELLSLVATLLRPGACSNATGVGSDAGECPQTTANQ